MGLDCRAVWTIIFVLVSACWALVLPACAIAATSEPAAATRTISHAKENLADALWIFEDPSGLLSINDIRSEALRSKFQPWDATQGDLNLGFSQSAWWIRLSLRRAPVSAESWILDVPYAFNRTLDFHAPGVSPVKTGHSRPLSSRPILSPHFAFPAQVADQPQDFYFRVASNYPVSVPLVAWQPSAYARHTLYANLLQALYHGTLIAMLIHAFFIWASSRDARFGLFALYALTLNLSMLAGNGWGAIVAWEGWYGFDEMASGIFLSFTMAALLRLVMRLLDSARTMPASLHQAMTALAAIAAIHGAVIVASIGHAGLAAPLYQSLFALGLLTIALISIATWQARRLELPGKYFFLASWSVISIGVVIATLRVAGWIPTNALTSYAVQIATGLEMLLLSFMLAQLLRDERQARLRTQTQLIEQLRRQEQRLEQSITERTQVLVETAQSERKTLAEYLRFAALVSHEFRNGLNVISAQSEVLSRQSSEASVGHRTQVIRQQVARLAKITDTWLRSDQILQMADPPELQEIDCGTWIASVVSKHPDGYNQHRIEWSIADDATKIWADRQLLEIVLLNLLSNACKYSPAGSRISISSCHRGEGGHKMTGLRVQDCGFGIEPAFHERIFDRYFRVHPEGAVSGTGLGLSLVRHIMEQHAGCVEVHSESGAGSTFTVWFPDRDQP